MINSHIVLFFYFLFTIGNINDNLYFDKFHGTYIYVTILGVVFFIHYLIKNKLLKVIKPFKLFILLIFTTLLFSILLSNNILVGLEKLIGLSMSTIVAIYIARTISYVNFTKILIKVGFIVFLLTIFISIFNSAIIIHQDTHYGDWKGIYDHKNVLGYFSLLYFASVLFNILFLSKLNIWNIINLLFSLLLLFLSSSRTAYGILIIQTFLGLIGYITIRYKIKLIPFFSFTLFLLFIYGLLSHNIFIENIGTNSDYISIFSFKLKLSGRLTIWAFSLLALADKMSFGYGYGGFWGVSEKSNITEFGLGNITLSDAHNGYIDLLLSTGIVGTVIIMFVLIFYFIKIYKYFQNHTLSNTNKKNVFFYLYFYILFLLLNLTESVLLKSTNFYQFFFMYILFSFIIFDKSIKLRKVHNDNFN